MSQSPWRPQGVLIAHLAEHRQSVNQLAVAGNGMFFASASNDETVKVWDCRRLEKDVSFKSRLSYTAQGELLWYVCLQKWPSDKSLAIWVRDTHIRCLTIARAAATADGSPSTTIMCKYWRRHSDIVQLVAMSLQALTVQGGQAYCCCLLEEA